MAQRIDTGAPRLRLLGGFALTGVAADLKSRKAQALLAYLALAEAPAPREALAALLWGDRFDDQARRSLRQAVFALRQALGKDAVAGAETLALAPGAVEVDARRFTADESAAYGGDLLAGWPPVSEEFDRWLDEARDRLRGLYHRRLQTATEAALAAGDDEAALASAERLLASDPTSEPGIRAAMQALAALGRRAEALDRFRRFADRLRAELDAAPGADLVILADALRSADETIAAPVLSAASPGQSRDAIILAPIEDLGGGDMASYLSRALGDEIEEHVNRLATVQADFLRVSPSAGDPVEEARRLGAKLIVRGHARQIGDATRIVVDIRRVRDDRLAWTHREVISDRNAFEAVEEVGARVGDGCWNTLMAVEAAQRISDDMERVIDDPERALALLANEGWRGFTQDHSRDGLTDLRRAAQRVAERYPDSDFALGFAGLTVFHQAHMSDITDRLPVYREAQRLGETACARRPGSMNGLGVLLLCNTWFGRFDAAQRNYDELLRNYGDALSQWNGIYGGALIFTGETARGETLLRQAMDAAPDVKLVHYRQALIGLGRFASDDMAGAAEHGAAAVDANPEYFLGHLVRIAGLAAWGRDEEAVAALAEMRRWFAAPSIAGFEFIPLMDEAARARFFDALRTAGLPAT